MATTTTATEAPNTLLSDGTLKILDMVCEGPIYGFIPVNGTYGNDPLVSTYYNDISVRNPVDGSYNYNITGGKFSFNYTLGTSDQSGILGFQKVESAIPLVANTRLANPPAGGGPYKVVVASFNTSVYPDADTIKVTVRVPSLFAQDDQSNTNPYSIDYAVDISVNNGQYVTLSNETIAGKCTADYQQTTVYTLPKTTPGSTFYEWKVRVRRVSQNILSIRTQNDIFVDTISVISSSLYAYPNTVLVGTEIESTQFGTVPTRAYDIMGLLVSVPSGYTPTQYGFNITPFTRQCDIDIANKLVGFTTQNSTQSIGVNAGMTVSGNGLAPNSIITSVAPGQPYSQYFFAVDQDPTGTFTNTTVTFYPTETSPTVTAATYPNIWLGNFQTGVWTDNPAWIFYDLLTNNIHGLGDYIQPGSVDKWTLYKISQYCDELVDDGQGGLEPRFTCNMVINDAQDAYTVLLNLASTFRGMLYYANGTIQPVQQQNDAPVYAFNNSNAIGGEFTYSNSAKNARATVAKVKYVDPSNSYRENIVYVEDVDGIQKLGYKEKEMTAFACTSQGQAYRLGSWALTSERLLTETITFQTDLEGVALKPGDNFAVYDNFRTNRNQAGRIIAVSTGHSVVTLDRSVPIEAGFVYSLSAIVPKTQLDASGSLTGSDQIYAIRQSQLESFVVANGPTSGTNTLTISGQFSSGIFVGSPFLLSASGTSAAATTRAQFYTCLATAEIEPGKIEILGLQANTGIQFAIQTGYTVIDWPANSGDFSAILPPTSLTVKEITGATANNTFYSSINVTWVNSPSPNLSYYVVSGKNWSGAYDRSVIIGTGFNYPRGTTGFYSFAVSAVSIGGIQSANLTGGILIQNQNPLVTLKQLSGIVIEDGGDPLYVNSHTGYTGYIGTTPTFGWQVLYDNAGQPIVDAQFITGYQLTIKSPDDTSTYYGPIRISGNESTSWQVPTSAIYGFPGGPQRNWKLHVDSLDLYNQVHTGAALTVNNPVMKPPFASGFVGFNGGLSYNVTPSLQYDTSGIYLWVNQDPNFTPTYSNASYNSNNLAGFYNGSPSTGFYWIWFALTDTFGASGNPIWGPISGDSNGVFQTFQYDISSQISGAFRLLSGNITNMSGIFTGADYLNLLQVQGLSGQVTGSPGVVNTALNVRVNNAVTSSSGALSTQIDAVSASVNSLSGYTNAQVGTLQSALATTGGALASWITNLGAVTSGQNASVQIGAQAFVTGSVNGLGGAAVATWGFSLDANGKVVSMRATSSNTYGQSSSIGTIIFGGADLQSDNFVAGSAGWKLGHDGSFTGNNGTFRGALDVGAGDTRLSKPIGGDLTFGNTSQGHVLMTAPSAGTNLVGVSYGTYQKAFLQIVTPGGGKIVGQMQVMSDDGTSITVGGSVNAGQAPIITWQNDTNLYRSAADTLKTDDSFIAGAGLTLGSSDKLSNAKFGSTVQSWGTSATQQFFGITTASKATAGFVQCASDDAVHARFDFDSATSTSGSIVVTMRDGTAVGTGPYRFSYLLLN